MMCYKNKCHKWNAASVFLQKQFYTVVRRRLELTLRTVVLRHSECRSPICKAVTERVFKLSLTQKFFHKMSHSVGENLCQNETKQRVG